MTAPRPNRLVLLSVCLGMAASCQMALGQDADPQAAERARAAYERAIQEGEARKAERDRDQAFKDRNKPPPPTPDEIRRANEEYREFLRRDLDKRFRQAFLEFQDARDDLGEALGFKTSLKKPARKIESSTRVFLELLKQTNRERPRFDEGEFKGFTATELGWETLTTAERTSPSLAEIIRNMESVNVDLRFLKSLPSLELELRRLQWMARKLR